MEKTKRLSKSSIAVIVLSILLVLSMVMGLTGAWFTDSASDSTQTLKLNFGKVDYELQVNTEVRKEGDKSETEESDVVVDGEYLLIAGTEIETGVTITNSSDVDSYYVLVRQAVNPAWTGEEDHEHDHYIPHYYYVDETNALLVEFSGTDAEKAAALLANCKLAGKQMNEASPKASVHFTTVYTVVEAANYGTAKGSIFSVSVNGAAATGLSNTQLGEITLGGAEDHSSLVYGDDVDLGLLLVTGTFEVRAIQADNLSVENTDAANSAQAWTHLTSGWTSVAGYDHTPYVAN